MANRFDVTLALRMPQRSLAILAIAIAMISAGALGADLVTGTVIDEETRQPLSGAYVLASYHEWGAIPMRSASWCVKTHGMYTGTDGRFSFPLEKMDGYSPFIVNTIKPGYGGGIVRASDGTVWLKRSKQEYRDLLVVMRRQNPEHPNFSYSNSDEYCLQARTAEDAAAGMEFMRIKTDEMARYGVDAETIASLRKIITERGARERASK